MSKSLPRSNRRSWLVGVLAVIGLGLGLFLIFANPLLGQITGK